MNSVSLSTPTTIGSRSERPLGRGTAGGRAQATRHLLHLVGLDDVADLDVGEIVETDAALVAGLHLAGIVLEALQAAHLAVVHDDAVADEPRLGIAGDLA